MTDKAHVMDDPQAILALRLNMVIRSFEGEVKHGIKLARNAPTVAQARQQYGITARTKKQAIEQLRDLQARVLEGEVTL
jgi:hypothetical protein